MHRDLLEQIVAVLTKLKMNKNETVKGGQQGVSSRKGAKRKG